MGFFARLWADFYGSFLESNRWLFYMQGLGNTLAMSVMACILGILLGLLIAIVKVTYTNSGKLRFFNWLCNLYTTVIRGTPVLVQLLIIYYMIFTSASADSAIFIAALAFGINSAAYVSEIIRAGILSIDKGQTEAGRSLGLSQYLTMRLIVLPQAIKNILPALFNEFISLLKETSVASYIAINEITRAGDLIRSRTWTFMSLLISACIYLILVMCLTKLQKVLERRLAAGDNR